ncbi:rhodanese-like domain-containing protein [Streptomyces sp. NPDC000983]|uniref:rhodanese-like domain-containing protein n=1 Tax=Streptomyces sp. NPDC000983 TaxID=3154373 RepID=UPI00332C6EA3
MSLPRRHRGGGPGRVTVREAAERTGGAGAHAVLLDVREQLEHSAGHVPWAVHLPLSALLFGAALPESAQARPVIVICRSGRRSRQAAELLAARGTDAVDVVGGMRDWAAAGLPVVASRGGNGTVA